MMNVTNVTENVKKFLGWCPNAGALAAKKVMITLPENEEVMDGKDGKIAIDPSGMKWANKYRNYILLMTISNIAGFALASFVFGYFLGMDFDGGTVSKGILIGTVIAVITLAFEWRQLNRIDGFSIGLMKSVFLRTYLQLAVFFAFIILLTFTIGKNDPLQFMLSLFFPSVWIHYPLVVYWEKKNKKTIYLVEEKLLRWRPVAMPDSMRGS